MSHTTVYRQVTRVRRTPVPRASSAAAAGLTAGFGRMLAKLTLAETSLKTSRSGRKRRR